jgi:regulator of nucleoside diphosphate kinase
MSESIFVTARDLERLTDLLSAHGGRDTSAVDRLEEQLGRATVLPSDQIPSDIVTMRSTVVVEDQSGARREMQLVYPKEANPSHGQVSVLAPIGSALLGLRVGQSIDWPLPGGRKTKLKIIKVLYQPEAAGHLDR